MRMQNVATAYILHPDGQRVLLLEHHKGNLKGKWLPPGGHCEPGERPDRTAVREALEETNQVIRLRDGMKPVPLPAASFPAPGGEGVAPPPGFVLSADVERLPQPLCIQVERISGVPEGEHYHLDFVYLADVAELRPLVSEKGRPLAWVGREEMERLPILEDVRRVLQQVIFRSV